MRGRAYRFVERATRVLTDAGHHIEAVATHGPNTATALARECVERGADLILVGGGDGTMNEVINGMVHSDVPVAILPGGTANVLANELAIGNQLEPAAKLISACTQHRISLGLLRCANADPRYFALMAGAGLDAHIVYHISARLKSAIGKVAYWISGFVHGFRVLPEFTVDVEGLHLRSSFALASRVRNYGGDLEIARDITLLDDDFEVVLFAGVNPFLYVKYLTAVLLGKPEGLKGVTVLRAGSVGLSSPEDARIYVQVDGEYAGKLPATVEIVPQCLTLLLPPDSQKKWTLSPTP